MASDGLSIRILTADVQNEFRRIDRASSRATMWTVRAGGRVAKQVARRNTRVYRGPKRNTYDFKTVAPLVPGEMKKSIHSSKRLKKFGPEGFAVTVVPRAPRTRLYRSKIEELDHAMQKGKDAAAEALPALAEQAWTRVTRRK